MTMKLPRKSSEQSQATPATPDPQKVSKLLMPEVEQRFGGLRTIARLLDVIAIIGGAFGLIAAFILAVTPTLEINDLGDFTQAPPNIGGAIAFAVGVVVSGIFLLALADLIRVQLAKEENARITNELLLQLMTRRRSQ